MNYFDLLRQQREFFQSGKTKSIDFRLVQLKTLKQAIVEYENAINEALQADLNKPVVETYLTEITVVKKEIDYAIKHLKTWLKPRKATIPIEQLPGTGKIYPEPLGIVLIISSWNYPLQLVLTPLVGAFFKFTAIFRTCHEQANIERDDALFFQNVGYVFIGDSRS